jgi:hypothetical protein
MKKLDLTLDFVPIIKPSLECLLNYDEGDTNDLYPAQVI